MNRGWVCTNCGDTVPEGTSHSCRMAAFWGGNCGGNITGA